MFDISPKNGDDKAVVLYEALYAVLKICWNKQALEVIKMDDLKKTSQQQ